MNLSPKAGLIADSAMLINIPKLITAYYADRPDPSIPAHMVTFGTSGHRGSSFSRSFNEWHILAVTQAICDYRRANNVRGPLYLGKDTHALSEPAFASALEVLAANAVDVMIDERDDYTPTPVISHAILTTNRSKPAALADGIVITPSHNPPEDGGFKYNPPEGGPASSAATKWIQNRANEFLAHELAGVSRVTLAAALRAPTTHRHDYSTTYVDDLSSILDLNAIKQSGLKLGVDPLGGAGLHYWGKIADRYGLNLTVVNPEIDPTFRFMTVDWDGKIRMDPSSPYAMRSLIGLKDRYDVAFACDPDHDRHGIVTRSVGLLPPNQYLAVCHRYLFTHRSNWAPSAALGKTVVSSSMIDRVSVMVGRRLYEVPVGFKWFVDGLLAGNLGFAGEESAGASFLRQDGSVWTTDKDGIIAALLAAEITARTGRDPGESYQDIADQVGTSWYERIDAPASSAEKTVLAGLAPKDINASELAGDHIEAILTTAPGDGNPIGGVKVITESGWFAARPSGTEEIYKLYAESFRGPAHLARIIAEAQAIVAKALGGARGSAG